MDVLVLLYYQHPSFFNKPQDPQYPICNMLAACQKLIDNNLFTLTRLKKILELPKDKLQEITLCNSKYELINCLNGKEGFSPTVLPKPTNCISVFSRQPSVLPYTAHPYYNSNSNIAGFFTSQTRSKVTKSPKQRAIKIETADGEVLDISTFKHSCYK